MDETQPKINPYAPSAVATIDMSPEQPNVPAAPRPLRKTAIRWLLVCGISAIPSFVYGLSLASGQIGGMITGILIFAAGYTFLDHRTAQRPWRQKKSIQRTLKVVFGTRIVISTILPIGFYLDLICGVISIGVTQSITGYDLSSERPMPFGSSLFATLAQGVTLNMALAVYAMIVHGIQAFIRVVRTWLSARE